VSETGAITIVARMALVLLVAVVAQTAVVADVRVAGAAGDIMLLVAIAGGLAGGSERGAAVGFAAGVAYDLVLATPLGLSALTYCLVAYVVGTVQGSVLKATRWIPVVAATIASGIGVTLYVVLGTVVGQDFPWTEVPRIAAVVAVVNALLVLVATRVVRWGLGGAPAHLGAVLR
jgi:rod shape-determining protein MreD